MIIENDIKFDFQDVLIRPKRSALISRQNVSLIKKYSFVNSLKEWEGLPIIASNMDGVGTLSMDDVLSQNKIMTCFTKFTKNEDIGEHRKKYGIPSFGISEEDNNKFLEFMKTRDQDWIICFDVANGYIEEFSRRIKKFRLAFPSLTIIAGNVCTGDMTAELILGGVDIVKVGIGSGAFCTTRIMTGVGYPQLSAIIECADAAHGLGGHIISDGGCNTPGDLSKAFAAGADFVMLGSMLAGHIEGDVKPNNEEVAFYGMSSEKAQEKHYGKKYSYRASEGRESTVPFRGSVKDTVNEILGGIRSACTYVGARCLKDLPKCCTFVRCYRTHNTKYEK